MVATFVIRFVGPALVFLSPLLVSVDYIENVLPFNAHLDGAFGWYQLVLLMFLGGWDNAFGDMLDNDDLLKRHLSPRLLQLMRFACHSHTICVGLVILCQSNPLPGAVLSGMYAHAWVVRGKAGIKSKPAEILVVLLALVPFWSLIGGRFFGMMGRHRLDQNGGFALPWLACLGSSNIWLPCPVLMVEMRSPCEQSRRQVSSASCRQVSSPCEQSRRQVSSASCLPRSPPI
jgi:hypothetical protein